MWPQWVLRRVNTREPIRRHVGQQMPKWTDSAEVKIKSVCHNCNNGWMSNLETKSIPLIGALLEDVELNLDASQQTQIALWALKTAMIIDSVPDHVRFYSNSECEGLKNSGALPPTTTVWLGRYVGRSLHAGGATFGINAGGKKVADGSATTIIIGHFILQMATTHMLLSNLLGTITVNSAATNSWSNRLIQNWPITANSVRWPPPNSFSNDGQFRLFDLVNRFKG